MCQNNPNLPLSHLEESVQIHRNVLFQIQKYAESAEKGFQWERRSASWLYNS